MNTEEEQLKLQKLREQKKLWARKMRAKQKGETLTEEEEQMVLQKKEADRERYRESKRLWAQKNRQKIKAEFGTCLTEKQKIHNQNYRKAHYEECKAHQREYARKMREVAKKLKSIKKNDCECQTDEILDDVLDKFTINVINI